ncbi:hypothetical protein D3C78_766810 [compost metagenome]
MVHMRKTWKWAVVGAAIAIIVIYGIEMSTTGIERVYGPLEQDYGYSSNVEMMTSANSLSGHALTQQQKIAQLERELAEVKRMAKLGKEEQMTSEVADTPYSNERLPGIPLSDDQPAVNRIADSTSGLLQSVSSEGIRFVVSLFDGLTN